MPRKMRNTNTTSTPMTATANVLPAQNIEKNTKFKTIIITVIVTIGILCFFVLMLIGCTIISLSGSTSQDTETGNVALIQVIGEISTAQSGVFGDTTASSTAIVEDIQSADKDPNIKAIIIEINSPGGSGVASEEIANALRQSKKLKVAYIREIGTSGAYWIASSTDYIYASRFSLTGSVGVLSSYIDFSGLLQRYNVSYEKITGGQYKDIGSPFRPLSDEERTILQAKVDKLHEAFLSEVVKNRKLSSQNKEEIKKALFYTGEEALSLGLIDGIGGKDEARQYVANKLNIKVKIKQYYHKKSFMDLLNSYLSLQSYSLGRGIGTSIMESDYKSNPGAIQA
jgi:protease IV